MSKETKHKVSILWNFLDVKRDLLYVKRSDVKRHLSQSRHFLRNFLYALKIEVTWYLIGLFWHLIGLFGHVIGVFWHLIGLFWHLLGLFWHPFCMHLEQDNGNFGEFHATYTFHITSTFYIIACYMYNVPGKL